MAEGAVAALSVVEGLDVVEDLGGELGSGGPGAAVDELLLDRREEALGDGVVVAVAAASHRLRDPGGAGLLAEGQRDELAALVGVPDQPARGAAVREGHLRRVDDELCAHVVGHGPPDDPARVEVLDGDEIQPALLGPEVGDVGHPAIIRGRWR